MATTLTYQDFTQYVVCVKESDAYFHETSHHLKACVQNELVYVVDGFANYFAPSPIEKALFEENFIEISKADYIRYENAVNEGNLTMISACIKNLEKKYNISFH